MNLQSYGEHAPHLRPDDDDEQMRRASVAWLALVTSIVAFTLGLYLFIAGFLLLGK